MGIAKKNKRKLEFNNQSFYWWIEDDFDESGSMLSINIATEDKKFIVKYFVVQNHTSNRFITVIGEKFPYFEKKNTTWIRFICPEFPTYNKQGIGPKTVREILEWCYDKDKSLTIVDYRGNEIM